MVKALNKITIPAGCFVRSQSSVLGVWIPWRGPSHWASLHAVTWFDLSCGSYVFNHKSGAPHAS